MSRAGGAPPLLPLLLAGAATAGLTAAYVLRGYLPTYNTPRTPIAGVPHPPASPPRPALARRVVLAVMDGLSFDLARELEELAPIRRGGAMRMLVPPFPSYTSPALVSFVTGLDPRDHGVRLNGKLTGAIGLDTVTRAAHDAGVPVALCKRGWDPFEEVMYPARREDSPFPLRALPGADVIAGRVRFAYWLWRRETAALAPAPLTEGSPAAALEIVYLEDVDYAGHRHGAASREYVEAAHHAGAVVARLAGTLDLSQDALVLVSDHSHRAEGGHGGMEPEVRRAFFLAAGRGIRRGVELDPRSPRDVAPTLSALAGLRAPTSSLARPMLDALDLDDAARARLLAGPFAQASTFACAVHPSPRCGGAAALAARLGEGDGGAVAGAEALLDALAAERDAEDGARAATGRRWRLGIATVALTAATIALHRRARAELAALARHLPLALLHAVIYLATLAALGHRGSFSSFPGEHYNRDTTLASSAAFAATMAVVLVTRPPAAAPWALLAGTAAPVYLLAAWVGADPAWLPPPIEAALLFLVAPLVLSAAATALAIRVVQRWPSRFV